MKNSLIISKLGEWGTVCVVGGYTGRQTGKPQSVASSPCHCGRAADGCAGHWLRFFVSNLDNESQVPLRQSSAVVLFAGGPGFKPRHELAGWLGSCLCDVFPIRQRCCCGSLHQHFLIRPFYPRSLQRAG